MRTALFALLSLLVAAMPARAQIVVGSKLFTESVILGEMAQEAITARTDEAVSHKRELGGTRIMWNALIAGEIDVYPDYTGTIRYEILPDEGLETDAALPAALATRGLEMSAPLGFSNTYAVAVTRETATRLGLRTTSDLRAHPNLRFGVSNEFLDRADGWQALAAAYDLPQTDVRGMIHDLSYRALASGQVDAVDAYTTDAQIAQYDLVLLEDDRNHFPVYDAVYLYRSDLPEPAKAALGELAGTLDEAGMQDLNDRAQSGAAEGDLAAEIVSLALGVDVEASGRTDSRAGRVWQRTKEHLALVGIALGAAIVIALPLGIAAARLPRFGNAILGAVGVLQTIPSLALFVILIPLLGIGAVPTIAALFLYSLLPVVRNTHAGLTGIAPALLDSADALGLSRTARLRRIELPLAAPTIMAGVKTAAVIAVGLATLGAIIGAGGYGQPILTGIRLASTPLILEGAIPAAVLALVMQAAFDLAERWITPRGLRLRQAAP
ncbi:glycine betaine ABC transporter substrate-binding protein [Pacificimonas flava]|uniref:L-proline glycine betaine binding ABC transporter protein ProX n=1 Tax=Pacificimonas flava TaxID=1234595 RepID=M2U303_9SPHN|nr:glycine betaine ABC transporter substrate-binding protein [Pacificimonas flava]EMD82342.1 L-proline glycine betaine binding ABC transporter protein ProX [Pacificimonas flava]MBB5280752.1 osmoprotectant transport system permease protein [Pacificimonas flava]